ncbi:unnamed protein product, partial [Didymodactylos carnosus]
GIKPAMVPPYNCSKAALISLTKEAAREYGKYHIRVNGIAPTVVLTPMMENYIENCSDPNQLRKRIECCNSIPGLPTPQDIAAAVAFLSSDDAKFISGVILPVDGGYLTQ